MHSNWLREIELDKLLVKNSPLALNQGRESWWVRSLTLSGQFLEFCIGLLPLGTGYGSSDRLIILSHSLGKLIEWKPQLVPLSNRHPSTFPLAEGVVSN